MPRKKYKNRPHNRWQIREISKGVYSKIFVPSPPRNENSLAKCSNRLGTFYTTFLGFHSFKVRRKGNKFKKFWIGNKITWRFNEVPFMLNDAWITGIKDNDDKEN